MSQAIAEGLDLPLSALRASMESLNRMLPADVNGNGPLEGALDEVRRLGRNVRDLMEFTSPPNPLPMRCTANEIAMSAMRGLAPEHRSRVTVARVEAGGTMRADAPLLARNLRRLLQNALEAGTGDVFLIVRRESGKTSFSVTDRSSHSFDTRNARSPFQSSKARHLGLGLALTERDVALMNGTLELRCSPSRTYARVTIPDADHRGGAA